MPEGPIKLTAEEFEALLFEVYKRGLQKGVLYGLLQEGTLYPIEAANKNFNDLMYELKFKTT